MDGLLVLVGGDRPLIAKVERLAAARGGAVATYFHPVEIDADREPDAAILNLELPGSLEAGGELRVRWPTALLAGFVSMPDPERWEAAVEAGYDLVANRGAIVRRLEEALEGWTGPRKGSRFRLFEAADVVGRLGLVFRTDETPVGAVAVYQIGKELFAVGDTCPHAGATLSKGTLEAGIVTCPLHGSQFDVRTGARMRGPADEEIARYRVAIDSGIAYLELD